MRVRPRSPNYLFKNNNARSDPRWFFRRGLAQVRLHTSGWNPVDLKKNKKTISKQTCFCVVLLCFLPKPASVDQVAWRCRHQSFTCGDYGWEVSAAVAYLLPLELTRSPSLRQAEVWLSVFTRVAFSDWNPYVCDVAADVHMHRAEGV